MPGPLTPTEVVEILDLMERPAGRVAAVGRKRRKCKRTALHPHCKSVKWSTCYEAVRRKGKSKKNAAQICNAMYNKWRQGRIKRKRFP